MEPRGNATRVAGGLPLIGRAGAMNFDFKMGVSLTETFERETLRQMGLLVQNPWPAASLHKSITCK
jgi:hypothetical protein